MILHTDIQELPFFAFEKAVVHGDLSGLIIKGNPEPADLLEAWSNLYAAYLDLMGDGETNYNLSLQRDISLLAIRITAIEGALQILRVCHVDLVVIALKDFGIDTSKLTPNNHRYAKELDKISATLARYRLELQEKSNELKERGADASHEAVTEAYFTKILSRLSKYQGYPLRKKELTVGEFAGHLKEYNAAYTKKQSTWQDDAAA